MLPAATAPRKPRAGRWTEFVKMGFGAAMILVSLWFFRTAWMLL